MDIRAALRITTAPPGAPVNETTTRSLVSHGSAMPWRARSEALVHPVRHPQQRQLPQRREVPHPEVVPQRRVGPLRPIDVAVASAGAGLRGHVDQLDLIGAAHHPVRDGFPLATPVMAATTSLSDSKCCTLTVEMTLIPASNRVSTSSHRLAWRDPGTLVWANSSTNASSQWRSNRASRSSSSKV